MFINIMEVKLRLQLGRVVAEAISCRPVTAEVRVRSQASPCGICGGQFDAMTCFFPSASYVGFPLNCRPASASCYAAVNRRTSGRSLAVFKQAVPCRLSGSVGRRSTFTLPFVSCYIVLLVGFFIMSCSLLSVQHSILCLSPISLFYWHVCLAQPVGHFTYRQQYCVARLLCISTKVSASSP